VRQEAGGFPEHGTAERDRVLPRLSRELVHEALDRKDVVVRPPPRQKPVGNRRGLGAHILDVQMRNVVGHVDGTVDRIDIDFRAGRPPSAIE